MEPNASPELAQDEAFIREFEPSRLIPDHEAVRGSFWLRSEATRKELDCTLDIPYGPAERQRLDIFPAAAAAAPVIVFIHGGYWRSLDKAAFSFLAPAFIAAGAACVVPNYGFAPATPMQDIVRHVGSAIGWVHANAQRHGGDAQRIYLIGHSAGAHLLAMLVTPGVLERGGTPTQVIRGGMAISGLYDLRPVLRVPFLNADLQLTPQSAAAVSPVLMQPCTSAPLWTSVGGVETAEFHRQTKLIEDQWPGVWAGHIAMPHSNHLSIVNDLATAGNPLNDGIAAMLAAPAPSTMDTR